MGEYNKKKREIIENEKKTVNAYDVNDPGYPQAFLYWENLQGIIDEIRKRARKHVVKKYTEAPLLKQSALFSADAIRQLNDEKLNLLDQDRSPQYYEQKNKLIDREIEKIKNEHTDKIRYGRYTPEKDQAYLAKLGETRALIRAKADLLTALKEEYDRINSDSHRRYFVDKVDTSRKLRAISRYGDIIRGAGSRDDLKVFADQMMKNPDMALNRSHFGIFSFFKHNTTLDRLDKVLRQHDLKTEPPKHRWFF